MNKSLLDKALRAAVTLLAVAFLVDLATELLRPAIPLLLGLSILLLLYRWLLSR